MQLILRNFSGRYSLSRRQRADLAWHTRVIEAIMATARRDQECRLNLYLYTTTCLRPYEHSQLVHKPIENDREPCVVIDADPQSAN